MSEIEPREAKKEKRQHSEGVVENYNETIHNYPMVVVNLFIFGRDKESYFSITVALTVVLTGLH